ncbi:MAG: M3 family metallopeptidase, partial [candidate division WOR-3 bacterium]
MIKEKFEKLLQEEIKNKENLESLLKEFYKITDEIYSIRNRTYVNWTGNTKNKEYEEKYKNFIEKIDPELKKYTFNFYKKIFDSGFIDEIENQVFKKIIEVEIRLHREENIELEKKEEELKMEYEKIISEFSFELEGKKLTLSEIESKLENKEREIREKAFFEMHFNIYKKREKFNKLMDELVKLRNKKAINADFKNYRDMCWIQLLRFDYRPEDTDEYREGVRKYIKPIYENYLEILKEKLKLKEIKPWDIFASIFQRDEIKLFKDEEELIKLALNVAERIDPFFKEVIEVLYKNKRLDLMARENKSQGGYMVDIHEDKLPYIFMNASGKVDDFMTFMHELGHCVNYMLSRDIENPYIRMPVSEFAELISIAMEFFTLEELKNIIDENLYKEIFTKYYSLI